MRLFGKVDSTIDRYDRAAWLTVPFDLSISSVVYINNAPYDVKQQYVWSTGMALGIAWQPGTAAGNAFSSGSQAGNVQE